METIDVGLRGSVEIKFLKEKSAKCPLTQVRNRGFWGCRRKSAETPVFMRIGRRFYSQLGPHLDFVSKNGSPWVRIDADCRTVLARQGGDLSVIKDLFLTPCRARCGVSSELRGKK